MKFSFEEVRGMVIKEIAYSNGHFGVLLFHAITRKLHLKMFDTKGKLVHEVLDDFKKLNINPQFYNISETGIYKHLFNTSDGGFVITVSHFRRMKIRQIMNYYHPKTKKSWVYETEEGAVKSLEVLGEFNQKLYVISSSTKNDFKLEGVDIKTGRISQQIRHNSLQKPMAFNNIIAHPSNPEQLIVTGAWVDDEKALMKEASKGLAIISIDKNGKTVDQKYLSWEKELSKFFNVSAKGKVEDLGYLFIHDIVSHDGKTFCMVAEGYNRSVNALGGILSIATAGSAGSFTKININDIVVLTMNENFELKNHYIIDQMKKPFEIPGIDYVNMNIAARIIKGLGFFNYNFSKVDTEKSRVQFYITSRLKKDEGKGAYFQILNFKDDKMEKIDLPFKTEATFTKYLVTEPGKIVIIDYLKKEKKIELRIESI